MADDTRSPADPAATIAHWAKDVIEKLAGGYGGPMT
jgi:hypothetical protein